MSRASDHADAPLVRDDAVRSVGQLFSTAARLERKLGSSLEREAGIPHVWLEVLLRLDEAKGNRLALGELGDSMVLTSGGMTRLIDRMSDTGLLERQPSPTDRRSSLAFMTTHGRELLVSAAAIHARNVNTEFTGPLGPKRLANLLDALSALG